MVQIEVEVIGLTRGPGADLLYGSRRGPVSRECSPDAAATLLAGRAEVLHSTSWRYEGDGTLVLTYAAVPGDGGVDVQPLSEPSVVCSGDALRPAPADLHDHHVAAHAARHLAYLLGRDPGITAAASGSRDPELWTMIAALSDVPTGTHAEAHRQAHRQPHHEPRHESQQDPVAGRAPVVT